MKFALICSSGGHFYELYSLNDLWASSDHFWVTFPAKDTQCLLKNDRVYFAYYPTNRNIKNFLKNLYLSYKILSKEKPDVIISTGAGVGVPFVYLGKLLGIKTIFIESLTRIHRLSLSGKLVYFFADHFFVQWPELAKKYKKARYKGKLI